VREEGPEEPELLVPGQRRSRPIPFPIPPALASHLGKVKISKKKAPNRIDTPPPP